MSDNKKYYYIKLKDNYFDQDNIRVLESVPNGHTYSLIVVKLYLKATKYGGQLTMTVSIPYSVDTVNTLASVISHDVAHVKEAIRMAVELDLISILDSGEMWMTEIQNLIGQSSSEGDRKRVYRAKIKGLEDKSGQTADNCPPDKEIDLELEKKKETIENHFKLVWKLYPKKLGKGKISAAKKKAMIKYTVDQWKIIIKRYDSSVLDKTFLMHGSSFFNAGYVDYLDENYQEQKFTAEKKFTDTKKYDYQEQSKNDKSFDKIPGVDFMKLIKDKKVNK